MKRVLTLLTIISFLSVSSIFAQDTETAGMDFFHGTIAEAVAKAKAENKLVFVDAYASWCGPCRFMSAQVFTQQVVGDFYNKNFINVKLDCEKNAEGPSFARKHGVRAYPTLIFLDGNGSMVHKDLGMKRTDDFIALGEVALSKKK